MLETAEVPTNALNCGFCLVLNNSSHHNVKAQKELIKTMEAHGFSVLSFTDINWSNMKILLKMTSKIACKKFMLFILSEGEKELIYDSNGKVIPIRRVLDFFAEADSPLRHIEKFFYFQTTTCISKGGREREEEAPMEEQSAMNNFILPWNSVCCRISSESSLVSRYLQYIEKYEQEIEESIPLTDMLKHSINDERKSAPPLEEGQRIRSHISSHPNDIDIHIDTTANCQR